jgi:hypothetical protein
MKFMVQRGSELLAAGDGEPKLLDVAGDDFAEELVLDCVAGQLEGRRPPEPASCAREKARRLHLFT